MQICYAVGLRLICWYKARQMRLQCDKDKRIYHARWLCCFMLQKAHRNKSHSQSLKYNYALELDQKTAQFPFFRYFDFLFCFHFVLNLIYIFLCIFGSEKNADSRHFDWTTFLGGNFVSLNSWDCLLFRILENPWRKRMQKFSRIIEI